MVILKKICSWVNPRTLTCECYLIWKQGLCKYNQLRIKMESYWIRVDLKFNKKRRRCRKTQRGGYVKTEAEIGANQIMPSNAQGYQKLKETSKDSPLEPRERAWPYWHLNIRCLVSITLKEQISVVLSHPLFWYFVLAALEN